MKKFFCLIITMLLFLSGTSVFAMQKWFLSDYIRWYENEDVAELLYNEYKDGYDEGYEDGTANLKSEKARSYTSGKINGAKETTEKYEKKYQGFAPWWTNIVTGLGVLAICVCVFSIIRKRDKNLSDSPVLTRAERKLKKQEQKVSKQKEIVEQKRDAAKQKEFIGQEEYRQPKEKDYPNNNMAVDLAELAYTLVKRPAETIYRFCKQYPGTILCKTSLIHCDTLIYSWFLLRASCIPSAHSRDTASAFDKLYFSKMYDEVKPLGDIPIDLFYDMFDNRTAFYERIFMRKIPIEEKLSALCEEFGLIVKMDDSRGSYVPYDEKSPVAITGIFEMVQCDTDIIEYSKTLITEAGPYLEQIENILESL